MWSEQITGQLTLVEQSGMLCILNASLLVTDTISLVTTALIM